MGVLLRCNLPQQKLNQKPIQKLFSPAGFQVLLWVSLPLLSLSTMAAPPCDDWMGRVIAVDGNLEISSESISWHRLKEEQYICPGDVIRTGEYSRASVYLSNNTYMRLDRNTLVHFPDNKPDKSFWIKLQSGIAHFLSRIVNRFEVETPYVNAMVEGTEFVVDAEGTMTVLEGQVLASSDSDQTILTPGTQASANASSQAMQGIIVDTEDSIQWTLYFPPVITLQEIQSQTTSRADHPLLQKALGFSQNRLPDKAIVLLERQAVLSPGLQLAKATLLLSVGRLDEARKLLAQLQEVKEVSHLVYALNALVETINNRPDSALKFARRSVTLAPDSSTAYLALSYAQQAAIMLEEATASAEQATRIAPENILAWYRLADLHLASAQYPDARAATEHALLLEPENPLTLIMAGYVALFELHLEQADLLFSQALDLSPGHPKAWLGRGLVSLRRGEIDEGIRYLETAVSLSPDQSILRSYLGRAYFEDKRDSDAVDQWRLASEFDEYDPTPLFYLGIQKLFANNPTGAVADLELAKALNHHRALYRSDRLLQSDSATRSAALARAYEQVGFDQAVLLEGWDALRQDPTSADGHRLLADRYAGLPNHETARVSELLQAQLWQPLSAHPLQPEIGESDLSILEGLGPSMPSQNEYHSLFTQNGVYGQLNAIAGGNDTWGEDAAISALQGPVALSLGQYHYQTDGFRPADSEQEHDIYNGLLQWQISPATTVQLEARKLDIDKHIYTLESISPDPPPKPQEINSETYRAGIRSHLNSHHDVAFSAIHQNRDEYQEANVITSDRSQKTIELQHIYKRQSFYLQSGVGQSEVEGQTDIGHEGDFFQLAETEDLTHKNFYTYLGLQPSESLFLLFGTTYDNQETDASQTIVFNFIPFPPDTSLHRTIEWSPKFGLQYSPVSELTLRLAAFKTIKRDITANQTIEPVQIVGFNQFYDDINGSNTKVYALGVDFAPDRDVRFGVENIYRKVKTPIQAFQPEPDQNQREFNYHHAYYYQHLTHQLSLNLGYEFEDIDLVDKQFSSSGTIYRTKTHIAQSGLNAAINPWLYSQADIIYTDQTVDASFSSSDQREFREHLWNLNLKVGVKLPKRLGEFQFGINNLFDDNSEILNSELNYLRYSPERFFYSRIQLSL
ncbi:FecR domain-containing protein [Hahella ganghwensis]|uniref:FecR domain-containing protein n=1 Tax=Hahella ganghwensis TaxID=286420 RepID=UPI00146155C3|nr:FecR domain-containing protein [Hahella ganghwensis]